jgi:hypothetical protein
MKLIFPRGIVHKEVNGQKVGVDQIDVQTACSDCGIDFCDCALIMTDLGTGDKYAVYCLDGALAFSAIADFNAYKESDDVADLNETVVASV